MGARKEDGGASTRREKFLERTEAAHPIPAEEGAGAAILARVQAGAAVAGWDRDGVVADRCRDRGNRQLDPRVARRCDVSAGTGRASSGAIVCAGGNCYRHVAVFRDIYFFGRVCEPRRETPGDEFGVMDVSGDRTLASLFCDWLHCLLLDAPAFAI